MGVGRKLEWGYWGDKLGSKMGGGANKEGKRGESNRVVGGQLGQEGGYLETRGVNL